VQVTQLGGFAALESPDGRTLYYAKTRFENPEVWRMPVNGGAETIFSAVVRPKSRAAWSVSDGGIFFCPPEGPGDQPTINFYDFATRLTRFGYRVRLMGNNCFITKRNRMRAAYCWWKSTSSLETRAALVYAVDAEAY